MKLEFAYNKGFLTPFFFISTEIVKKVFLIVKDNIKQSYLVNFKEGKRGWKIFVSSRNLLQEEFPPAILVDFLTDLQSANLINNDSKDEFLKRYTFQYVQLPHIGKNIHFYNNKNIEKIDPVENYQIYDITQPSYSKEVKYLRDFLDKCINTNIAKYAKAWLKHFQKLEHLANVHAARKESSNYDAKKILKKIALSNMHSTTLKPGKNDIFDWILLGFYQNASNEISREKLRETIENIINNNKALQPLFMLIAFWSAIGVNAKFSKNKLSSTLARLKIIENFTDSDILNSYKSHGFYNLKNSIYLNNIMADNEGIATFIHEAIHAINNILFYNNTFPVNTKNKKEITKWQEIAELFIKEIIKNYPIYKADDYSGLISQLNYSEYDKKNWSEELVARWAEVQFLNPHETIKVDEKISIFMQTYYQQLSKAAMEWCRNFMEEHGLLLIKGFDNFYNFNDCVITLTQEDCGLLNEAINRKITLLDLVIEQGLKKFKNEKEIVEELQQQNINVTAIMLSGCKQGYTKIVSYIIENNTNSLNDFSLYKAFNLASINGHRNIVKLLLDYSYKPNLFNNEMMALHYAAANNHTDILEIILLYVNVMVEDEYGNTALDYAARYGCLSATKLLIEKGAVINHKDLAGNTALHIACIYGHNAVVAELIKNKDNNINITDEYGNTPLHCAIINNHTLILRDLLSREDCQVNMANLDGATPLYEAVKISNTDMVKHLLAHPDINLIIPNNTDGTALLLAIESKQHHIVMLLLAKDKNIIDVSGNCFATSILSAAAQQGMLDVIKLFPKSSLQFEYRCNKGKLPIHYAAEKGYVNIVDYMSFDIELLDKVTMLHETPLQLAIWEGQEEVVDYLLDKGVMFDNIDVYGKTLLHLAIEKGHNKIAKRLMSLNCQLNMQDVQGNSVLHYAIQYNNYDIFQQLLCFAYVSINALNKKKQSPLMLAILKHCTNFALLLLKKENIELDYIDSAGNTALQLALKQFEFSIAELIIAKSCYFDYINNEKKTVLHLAVELNKVSIVKALLEKFANVNIEDAEHCSPLLIAAKAGFTQIVEALLCIEDIDVNTNDINGLSALHWAVKNNHYDICQLLINRKDIWLEQVDDKRKTAKDYITYLKIEKLFTQKNNLYQHTARLRFWNDNSKDQLNLLAFDSLEKKTSSYNSSIFKL
jgi:ankyrin repeat protein